MSTELPQLDISCDGCGICCMHMSVPPFDDEEVGLLQSPILEDYLAVKESRRLQLKVHGTDYTPCGWFDMATRKCKHYYYRPVVCRVFEVGNTYCLDLRKDGGLK